jgi:hypothetical protein
MCLCLWDGCKPLTSVVLGEVVGAGVCIGGALILIPPGRVAWINKFKK